MERQKIEPLAGNLNTIKTPLFDCRNLVSPINEITAIFFFKDF